MSGCPWLFLAVSFIAGIALTAITDDAANGVGKFLSFNYAFTAAILAALFFTRAVWSRGSAAPSGIFRRATFLTRWHFGYLTIALCLVVFAIGSWRYENFCRNLRDGESFVAAHGDQAAAATMKLLAAPEMSFGLDLAGRWNAPVALQEFNGEKIAKVRLRVYGNGILALPVGGIITAKKLRIYREVVPPFADAFSARALNKQEKLSGAGRLVGDYTLAAAAPSIWPRIVNFSNDWRRRGVTRLLRLLPDERGSFLAAIVFGWTGGLTDDTTAAFRYSGLGHVLAISGLHVGLVAVLSWFFTGLFISDVRQRALLALAVVLLFLAVSGGRASALRAGVIAGIYFSGIVVIRRADFLNSLGLAALLILSGNPAQLFAVGFQLSFLAVLFISCFQRVGERYLAARAATEAAPTIEEQAQDDLDRWLTGSPPAPRFYQQVGRYLRQGFLVCAAATLGTAPLVAYYFNLGSLISLAVNLVAVPLLTPALIGVTGVFLLPTQWLLAAPIITQICALPVAGLLAIADYAAAIPAGWFTTFTPPMWTLAIYYAFFAGFFVSAAAPWRRWLIGGLLVLLPMVGYTCLSLRGAAPGIFLLSAAKAENLFYVNPAGDLHVVLLSAEHEWREIMRFCLALGQREIAQLTVAPEIVIDPHFLRRIPAREIIRLNAGELAIAAGRFHYTPLTGGAFSAEFSGAETRLLLARGLREKQLSVILSREKKTAPVYFFLRKTPIRKVISGNGFYSADCTGAARLLPRETWGAINWDVATHQWRGWNGREYQQIDFGK